jgi:hypothetical protein
VRNFIFRKNGLLSCWSRRRQAWAANEDNDLDKKGKRLRGNQMARPDQHGDIFSHGAGITSV